MVTRGVELLALIVKETANVIKRIIVGRLAIGAGCVLVLLVFGVTVLAPGTVLNAAGFGDQFIQDITIALTLLSTFGLVGLAWYLPLKL